MTHAQAAEDGLPRLDRHANRNHAVQSARDLRSRGIGIRKAGVGKRQISIDRHPRREPCVVRPFDPDATAWATWFCRPCIPDEQQF